MNKPPNIILISADSLRADHLACYGYSRATSPNIDELAAGSTLLENMFCPVIPTQPSHTTMFTGQHPLTHGVVAHGGKAKLAQGAPLLAEIFTSAGFTTCAVDTLFRERVWFGRGYEYVIDPSVHHVFYANVTQEELNDRALHWITSVAKRPFYLFIHYWDTHYPYVPPKQYSELFYDGGNPTDPDNHALDPWWSHPLGAIAKDTWLRSGKGVITDPDYVTALYDREARYLDDGIGHLRASLERLGLAEDTMIVLLADHGESMTEHRIFFDHYGLYDCTLRVPCIMSWPGGRLRPGVRLKPMRQLSDIAPTILEAAGMPVPSEMDGKSLLGQLRGEEEPSGYDEILSLESTWQAKYCLRTRTHKFILSREQDLLGNPLRELYDLEADPGEECNLVDENTELAASMETEIEERIAQTLRSAGRQADPVKEEGASMVGTWLGRRS